MSLCNKSLSSCGFSGEEDIFLHLVRRCGLVEATHWAETMDLPHTLSSKLLSQLLFGSAQESCTPRPV
jgi:hypothetical protein